MENSRLSTFEPKVGTPVGKRFTEVYRARGEPTQDSEKLRHRIGVVFAAQGQRFAEWAERELGLDVPGGMSAWPSYLKKWNIDDVLNAITVYFEYLTDGAGSREKASGRCRIAAYEFNKIFEQENVAYRVDGQGGVHFAHDAEFTRNAESTIAGLALPRYANSRDRFESAIKAMGGVHPDGKTAIRDVFAAAEGLFRIILPKAHRLAGDQVQPLEQLIAKRYVADRTSLLATNKMLAAFRDWIEACHFYRHEPGTPDQIAQPPLELAIHLVSVGAAFIRLLVEIDEAPSS